MDIGETKENCDYENYNNIKEDIKMSSKINNFLRNDDINIEDENEYKEIKDELEKYKKEKEKEVEDLEKELAQLKNENAKYDNAIDENINILSNEDMIEQLKKDIIKKIEPEIIKKYEEIQNEINKKLEKIKKENENYIEEKYKDTINNDIKKFQKDLEDKYLNEKNKNNDINLDNNKINENKQYKVRIRKNNQKNNLINKDNNIEKSNPNMQTIKNKEIMGDDNNNVQKKNYNYFNHLLINNYEKENNEKKNKLDVKIKNAQPVNPKLDIPENKIYEKKEALDKTKKDYSKDLFNTFQNIFFKNKEQTSIKSEKINEYQLDKLTKLYFKFQNMKKELILTRYFDDFVKTNLLKLFEKKGIDERIIDNLKYNIETILVCFDLNKYNYKDYYYPENNRNTQIRDRKKSLDAAKRFRKEFNIDESIIKEEELLKRLDKNDNDIIKVLQQMYG